jgi:hypothetical protein
MMNITLLLATFIALAAPPGGTGNLLVNGSAREGAHGGAHTALRR